MLLLGLLVGAGADAEHRCPGCSLPQACNCCVACNVARSGFLFHASLTPLVYTTLPAQGMLLLGTVLAPQVLEGFPCPFSSCSSPYGAASAARAQEAAHACGAPGAPAWLQVVKMQGLDACFPLSAHSGRGGMLTVKVSITLSHWLKNQR